MKILTQQQCPVCEGTKMVQHPAWAQYYKEGNRKFSNDEVEECEKCVEWLRKNNYMVADAGTQALLPPEEIHCHECGGTGRVEEWMEVGEFAKIYINEKIEPK
jgi:RNA polymerase subunit RPABC4/transcription elongation factor Spt4